MLDIWKINILERIYKPWKCLFYPGKTNVSTNNYTVICITLERCSRILLGMKEKIQTLWEHSERFIREHSIWVKFIKSENNERHFKKTKCKKTSNKDWCVWCRSVWKWCICAIEYPRAAFFDLFRPAIYQVSCMDQSCICCTDKFMEWNNPGNISEISYTR